MSGNNDENRRSLRCNARLLRSLRESMNWSQKQLAQRSGYSIRLISKAEAGGSVAYPTIEVLAKTLSSDEFPISAADLVCDPESMAKSFVIARYQKPRNMADIVRDFVDPKCVFSMVGNPKTIPFAGDYVGLRAFASSVSSFFDFLEVRQDTDHVAGFHVIASKNKVVLWGESWISPVGRPAINPTPVAILFCFRNGLLHYYQERNDIMAIERYLAQAVKQQAVKQAGS